MTEFMALATEWALNALYSFNLRVWVKAWRLQYSRLDSTCLGVQFGPGTSLELSLIH